MKPDFIELHTTRDDKISVKIADIQYFVQKSCDKCTEIKLRDTCIYVTEDYETISRILSTSAYFTCRLVKEVTK